LLQGQDALPGSLIFNEAIRPFRLTFHISVLSSIEISDEASVFFFVWWGVLGWCMVELIGAVIRALVLSVGRSMDKTIGLG